MNRTVYYTAIMALYVFISCNYVDNKKLSVLSLRELPGFVQDSLRKLNVDKYGCYPDLIDFTNKFHYRYTKIGPWQHDQILTDSINHISYSFSYNTPRPFIVTSSFIAFPMDYVNSREAFKTDTLSFKVFHIK